MKDLLYNPSKKNQYITCIVVISLATIIGLAIHQIVGYQVVGFLLLISISALAMFLDILPVVLGAALSALLWDFFFIPPRFTFTVGTTEDRLLLLTYFVVALVHAVLTFKIKQAQRQIHLKEEKARELKLYNTLLNSLSHELRTPITTIIGATDNLNHIEKLSQEDRIELISEISKASLRLNEQVENLLNMSRLESGTLQIKKDWCDVKELIYTALHRLEPALSKYTVRVTVSENFPLFKLDFGLMEQVIHNLVGNAVQHTPEGTDIVVEAAIIDEKLILSISDSGKGFPEADIRKVFEKFYRIQGSRSGGTGLGLSIVKGFVEAHGGVITLQNLPLRGALFTIEIPTEVSYVNSLKNE